MSINSVTFPLKSTHTSHGISLGAPFIWPGATSKQNA